MLGWIWIWFLAELIYSRSFAIKRIYVSEWESYKFGNKFLLSLTRQIGKCSKWKPVSALQSKKVYFYIAVSFRYRLSLWKFNIFLITTSVSQRNAAFNPIQDGNGVDYFSLRNPRVTKLWSHDDLCNIIWVTWQNFIGDVMDKNNDVITFVLKYVYSKKVWGSHLCWHHQNCNHVY